MRSKNKIKFSPKHPTCSYKIMNSPKKKKSSEIDLPTFQVELHPPEAPTQLFQALQSLSVRHQVCHSASPTRFGTRDSNRRPP
ncbi:hypothetical protein QJS04_geneDACA002024 [Acorus gramineus]|uniref:Uncharacterized protein n=1 Tax=Acorus gramineus TaxID=55184 RepID=A0AAV9A9D4_ACOGR|nr:hypothetical protein QJS04_geneDACA002024 [Acorus gramineus]